MEEPTETEYASEEEATTELTDGGGVFGRPSFVGHLIRTKHSFGYNCKRLFNLVLMGEDCLIFASGNYLHYYHVRSNEVTFRESTNGSGFGFITRNEHKDFINLLTVGENGKKPVVYIYKYPSHDIVMQLHSAAKACFTCAAYNSKGNLLATQAGHPDFMLTIWRWQKGEVVLRSKSFGNAVLHVHFSEHNPILLSSCGMSHIKFWKMANTFTGLKLKGDLGRFGKTDFTDIYANYMLPDENVISGSEWGNMLLWEAGLIKFEICRKGRRPCHAKAITHIQMKDGEVTTFGMDGYVRVWFWETVDLADPPDDDRFVEIDPIYEFYIGDCEIRAVQKIRPFDEHNYGYYLQDGKGGIWYCDINIRDIPQPSRKLYTCPGGKVIAAQTSLVSPLLMVLAEDGKLFLYDYQMKILLLEKTFVSIATDLLWLSPKIINTGMEFVMGFEDAVLRQFILREVQHKWQVFLINALKGHTARITALTANPMCTILVTGAEDRSIFYYYITNKVDDVLKLHPMGFIELEGIPNCYNWMKNDNHIVLIGCTGGEVYEFRLRTDISQEQTTLTYRLNPEKDMKKTKFVSIKSRIRRDLRREATKKRKEAKRQRKLKEIEKLKAANPGLQIDMETALADSESDEEEPPLFIPPKPNPVLWLRYTDNKTVWVNMGGYDAGYIYELDFNEAEPVYATLIAHADDIEIHSCLDVENFLLFGMNTGHLRINNKHPVDHTNLKDFVNIPMHDRFVGKIPAILITYTSNSILTIGYDGNIFLYDWRGPKLDLSKRSTMSAHFPELPKAQDIEDPEHPSMEQEKIFAELKRQEDAALEHERKVLGLIGDLQIKFNKIVKINSSLPEGLRVKHREMLLDDRITNQIRDELQAELDDVHDDMAYDLEFAQVGKTKLFNHFLKNLDHIPFTLKGVGDPIEVSSFRVESLGEEHQRIKEDIEDRLALEAVSRRTIDFTYDAEKEPSIPEPPEETFFFHRDPNTITPKFNKKMLRLLRSYRARQLYEIERTYNWDKLARSKPDPTKNHPDDDRAIRNAEREIGDYKLKVNPDYVPEENETLTYKYIEIVDAREKLYYRLSDFNKKLIQLRDEKVILDKFIKDSASKLEILHRIIPKKNHLQLPEFTEIIRENEIPEKNLVEHYKPSCGITIDDLLYCEATVQDLLPKVEREVKANRLSPGNLDNIKKYYAYHLDNLDHLPTYEDLFYELENLPDPSLDSYWQVDPETGRTPWLQEMRYRWLIHSLRKQDQVINDVSKRIGQFNDALRELSYERVEVKADAEFMYCHMIALNQELQILRDSEEIERTLEKNADTAMKNRNEIQQVINNLNRQIEDSRKLCEKLTDQISALQVRFMSTIKGHKFFDFLRRIFKKKWRPPKPPKQGDESSESSEESSESSEEEDADTKSIDSTDITAIRLDEDTCPAGLDRSLYDLTFKMRTERHELERTYIEQQESIQLKKQDILTKTKKMKYNEEVYANEMETLHNFRHRRQMELNKVQVSVILRMNQLQHFYEGEDYHDLSNAVLFDTSRLTKLNSRVNELNEETIATKRWHRINWVHLRRMNRDITFMKYETTRLEESIREAMRKKFGIELRLDELQEEVLRKYVFDLETTAEDQLREIDEEIREKQKELAEYQQEFIRETQLNTEKTNILAVLTEEKNFLDNIIAFQDRNYGKWLKPPPLDLNRDIEKLLTIEKEQKATIECLEREICTLRMKVRPLQVEDDIKKDEATSEIFHPEEALGEEENAEESDRIVVCPGMFSASAYMCRRMPDDLTLDRVQKMVQKLFLKAFGSQCSREQLRKYATKVARYLAQAAYSFEGRITDRILDCLTESLHDILPKKYFMHVTNEQLQKLLNDVLCLFDYERSDGNTEDVVSGIFEHAMEAMANECEPVVNKTQYVLINMFKELIEVLPLEEFASEVTLGIILDICEREEIIEPKFIAVENLVETVVKYARENMLDGITAIPIRRLAESVRKELLKRKKIDYSQRCSLGSVASVTILKKNSNTSSK